MNIESKLPATGDSIFAVMTAMAVKHNALNLSQGFPNFDPDPLLQELVFEYMKKGYNQYAPMPGIAPLRSKISEKIKFMYGVTPNADTEITITSGGTQALFTAITALIRKDDEVILFEPAYDSYGPAVTLQGGRPVPVQLHAPDMLIDWQEVRNKVTPNTRMIVFNNPHNPTGKIYTHEDLVELQSIVCENNLILLSDEVYEHILFDGKKHSSVLNYEALYQRSLVVFSFGKTYHNTGWKMGYCIAPEALTREFRKTHQFNVFSSNTPIQWALSEYMDNKDAYLQLPDFYQKKRDLFLNIMKSSRMKALACEGTYFCLFDYSAISYEPDMEFVKKMVLEAGVATIPVSVFNTDGTDEKLIRICFAKDDDTMEKGAQKLIAAGY